MVDNHLRPPQMIYLVEHIGTLKLPPLHLLQVQSPYYGHLAGREIKKSSKNGMVVHGIERLLTVCECSREKYESKD